MKYYKTRYYDSDVHVYEYNPLQFESNIEFGVKGKYEKLSQIINENKLKQGYTEKAKINLGFFGSSEHHGSVFSPSFVHGNAEGNSTECWLTNDGKFHIGSLTNQQVNELRSIVQWGCSLSFSLLIDGKKNFLGSQYYTHFTQRNPRTLIGQKADKTMVLVVVEGRTTTDKGVTGEQSADIMLKLRCTNSINCDGGGSSTMIVDDKIKNVLSDGSERNIGSALVVYEKIEKEVSVMTYKLIQDFLTPNSYSRPQTKLKSVKAVVIHWFANPNSTAKANRNFFENRKHGKTGYGSAHYLVDLDGTRYQALPESEVAYHVGSHVYTKRALTELSTYPNNCTLGIECSHVDLNGKMTLDTWKSTVELAADLLKRHKLTVNDLWLHYDTNGWKDCHRLFFNNKSEWARFKSEVNQILNGKPIAVPHYDPFDDELIIVNILGHGDKGNEVKELQGALKLLGYYNGELDGSFGNMSHDAVVKFQQDKKIIVDGIVGKQTREFIEVALKGKLNQKEESKLYKPSSTTITQITEKVLKEFSDKNINGANAIDPSWATKLNKGELTDSDLIGLLYIALDRGLLKIN